MEKLSLVDWDEYDRVFACLESLLASSSPFPLSPSLAIYLFEFENKSHTMVSNQHAGTNTASADPENVPSVSEEARAKKASSGGDSMSQTGDDSPQSVSQDNGSEIDYRTLAWWYVYRSAIALDPRRYSQRLTRTV